MTLRKVEFVDRNANYAYAPPTREAVINVDEIVSAVSIAPEHTRNSEPLVRVRFRDGSVLDVVGKPGDFVDEH
jgi:hypothetical protein